MRATIRALSALLLIALWGAVPSVATPLTKKVPRGLPEFSRALLSIEAGRGGTVRVLHFGDSHVAGEDLSSVVRDYLAGTFGDGGPGHFLPWSPPRYYRRLGVSAGNTAGWRRVLPSREGAPDDAGLSGCYMEADGPGNRCWASATFSRMRVELLRQPGGGTAELYLDGKLLAREELASRERSVALFSRDLEGGDLPHRIEIKSSGEGRVRILGVSLERGAGMTYSPMGVLGARADILLKNRPETFAALLREENPQLVILGYGTNEAGDRPFDSAAYATSFEKVLRRIRSAAPDAFILVLGPPDRAERGSGTWRSMASVPAVAEAQRRACAPVGASFLDLTSFMGGDGSAQRWATASPPLAQGDRVHFTSGGYALLGRAVAKELLEHYNGQKASPAFRDQLEGAGGSQALLAAASKPTPLPAEPPVTLSFASAAPPAEPTEAAREIYYFRNARGVLVITDDPSYAQGQGGDPEVPARGGDEAAGVFYFERPDGTLVVTNDREELDGQPGRFLTPQEVRARSGRTGAFGSAP